MHIDLPEKLYYTIGEVAKAFDVNTSLIRFWEKEFDILQPRKSSGGKRRYSRDDVKKLQAVYHLVKEKGYTLEGAKTQLKDSNRKTLSTLEIIHKLETIKASLLNIRAHL